MIRLKFTQEYFMIVEPDWYDPDILTGEGTLNEQICAYERNCAETKMLYTADLQRGSTMVEIVPELPNGLCGNKERHEPHEQESESLGTYMCTGDPDDREPYRSEQARKEKDAEPSRQDVNPE